MDNFTNSPQDEQQKYLNMMPHYDRPDENEFRVGFGRRFGAAILDILFNWILISIAFLAFGIINDLSAINWQEALSNPKLMEEVTLTLLKSTAPLTLIISLLYYSMEVFFHATPGKMLLGLKIANENRTDAGMTTLLIRFAIKNCSYFFTILFLLTWQIAFNSIAGWSMIFMVIAFFFTLSAKRQALYDKWSKTAVFFKDEILQDSNDHIQQ